LNPVVVRWLIPEFLWALGFEQPITHKPVRGAAAPVFKGNKDLPIQALSDDLTRLRLIKPHRIRFVNVPMCPPCLRFLARLRSQSVPLAPEFLARAVRVMTQRGSVV
jgi:hypothetical protein